MHVSLSRAPLALASSVVCLSVAPLAHPQCSSGTPSSSTYLKASVPGPGDGLGGAVAAYGDLVVVGAPWEDSGAVGVDGDPSDDSARDSGAVFVYRRAGLSWSLEAYLKASNTDAGDGFGSAVAVHGDTIAVGAPFEDSAGPQLDNGRRDAGAVYVYREGPGGWTQEAYLKPAEGTPVDHFGASVAAYGDRVLVGAPQEDSVPGDPSSDALPDSGAAYVFTRAGTTWTQQALLKASNAGAGDWFGSALALDLDLACVGAEFESSALLLGTPTPADDSAPAAGAAYVFTPTSGGWNQEAFLKASNAEAGDHFGSAVGAGRGRVILGAPAEDGAGTDVSGDPSSNTAPDAGAAYVFARTSSGWIQEAYVKATNTQASDRFGSSVSLRSQRALVGAPLERSAATGVNGDGSDNSALNSGAAYLFVLQGAAWSPSAYLKASNTNPDDVFASAVAMSDRLAVVGAPNEDGASPGVHGDPSNNAVQEAGAAYAFVLPRATPGTATVRAGTPANPQAFLPVPGARGIPRVGHRWTTGVDHALVAPGATMDFLLVSLGPKTNLALASGTLLCDPASPHRLLGKAPQSLFELPIPDDCALLDVEFCAQAAALTPTGLHLLNALDAVIGSF